MYKVIIFLSGYYMHSIHTIQAPSISFILDIPYGYISYSIQSTPYLETKFPRLAVYTKTP